MLKLLFLKSFKANSLKQGFTLIELLIVVIILGILSAIAIPSFLGAANKARQSEAKLNLSSLNKAQQVFYLENSEFVEDVAEIGKLGVGINPETNNYSITFDKPSIGMGVVMIAKAKSPAYKSYASGIGLIYQGGADTPATLSALCESTNLGQALDKSAINIVQGISGTGGGQIVCNSNTVAVQ